MAKTKVKNIVIMTILIILVMVSTVKATNNSIASEIDMNNKEEVSNTIRDLILTIGSEGMQKNLLSEAINMYTEATKTYSNEEIAGMIEEHKDELTQNGIKSEDIDSMVKWREYAGYNKRNNSKSINNRENWISSGCNIISTYNENNTNYYNSNICI